MAESEALASLLEALADTTCIRCRWSFRCYVGTAGHVDLSIDVDPRAISVAERDALLSVAARLTNWSHH